MTKTTAYLFDVNLDKYPALKKAIEQNKTIQSRMKNYELQIMVICHDKLAHVKDCKGYSFHIGFSMYHDKYELGLSYFPSEEAMEKYVKEGNLNIPKEVIWKLMV